MNRERFPAVVAAAHDGIVLADNAGGTQVPRDAIDAAARYLERENAQKGGPFARKLRTTEMVERARAETATLLGVPAETIAFGPNSTSLAFDLARLLAPAIRPGDRVVVTDADHFANVMPWTWLRRFGAEIERIPVDARGELDRGAFEDALAREPVLVAFPAASNGTGNTFDIAALGAAAKRAGALVVVDAVQAVPHLALAIPPDVDALFFSAYKVYGPHLGALYTDPAFAERFFTAEAADVPSAAVHWTVETGTQSHEALAAWLGTLAYLREAGDGDARSAIRRFSVHEEALAQAALAAFLRLSETLTLYGRPPGEARLPVFAFNVRGTTPDAVGEVLSQAGIEASVGDYYAPRLMRTLARETDGVAVRLSFAHYNTLDDVRRCFAAFESALAAASRA